MIEKGERFLIGKSENFIKIVRFELRVVYSASVKWKVDSALFRLLLGELSQLAVLERFLLCLMKSYKLPADEDVVLRLRLIQPVFDQIDYKWCCRICALTYQAMTMEWLFWSLSTLGGAVSAMADYIPSFVNKARIVSIKQLDLANHIGDPVLISRCHLFIALSLAQNSRQKTAAEIVRQEFVKAKKLKSEFLISCCKGVWAKLTALRLNKRKSKCSPTTPK